MVMVMEKLLLAVDEVFRRLVCRYSSSPADPLLGVTSKVDVSKSFSMTICVTILQESELLESHPCKNLNWKRVAERKISNAPGMMMNMWCQSCRLIYGFAVPVVPR